MMGPRTRPIDPIANPTPTHAEGAAKPKRIRPAVREDIVPVSDAVIAAAVAVVDADVVFDADGGGEENKYKCNL